MDCLETLIHECLPYIAEVQTTVIKNHHFVAESDCVMESEGLFKNHHFIA